MHERQDYGILHDPPSILWIGFEVRPAIGVKRGPTSSAKLSIFQHIIYYGLVLAADAGSELKADQQFKVTRCSEYSVEYQL